MGSEFSMSVTPLGITINGGARQVDRDAQALGAIGFVGGTSSALAVFLSRERLIQKHGLPRSVNSPTSLALKRIATSCGFISIVSWAYLVAHH